MATVAGLLHHLIDHAPALSETNRQEYHDVIDQEMPAAEEEQAEEEQAPEGQ